MKSASGGALETPGARTTREEMAIRPPYVTLRRPPTAVPAFARKLLSVAGPPAGTGPGEDPAPPRTRVAAAPRPSWRRGSSPGSPA